MAKLSEYSSVIKCFLSAILFINFTLAMQCETFALASANCADASGIQMGICVDTHNDSLDVLLQMQIANHSWLFAFEGVGVLGGVRRVVAG